MRPSVDVHYRVESLEEANLTFILQKPRASEIDFLIEDIDKYVNDPNFCKYFFLKKRRGLELTEFYFSLCKACKRFNS